MVGSTHAHGGQLQKCFLDGGKRQYSVTHQAIDPLPPSCLQSDSELRSRHAKNRLAGQGCEHKLVVQKITARIHGLLFV